MRNIGVFLVITIIFTHILIGQSLVSDTTQARKYLILATKLAQDTEYDSAIGYYKQLEFFYRKHEVWEGYLESLNGHGNTLRKLGRYDEAFKILEDALPLGVQYLRENHPLLAHIYYNMGSALDEQGDYDKALVYCQKALGIRLEALSENHPDIAESYNSIGNIVFSQGNFEKAFHHYQNALKIRLIAYKEVHSDIAGSYVNLGNVEYYRNNFDEVMNYYQKALEILITTLGADHLHIAMLKVNIGSVWELKGRYNKAITYYQEALPIFFTVFGEEHPNLASIYTNLGNIWIFQGEDDKAINYYQKALKIKLVSLGENHPNIAIDHNNLGIAWANKGDFTKAISSNQKALAIRLATLGKMHPDVAISYNNIGDVWFDQGDHDKASFYYKQAQKIFLKVYGRNHHRVAQNFNNLGVISKNEGDYERAIDYYQQALSIFLLSFGKGHPDVIDCYSNMAELCAYQGNYEKAIAYHQQALHISDSSLNELSGDYENPNLENINFPISTLSALQAKGNTLQQAYSQGKYPLEILRVSLTTYQLAIDLIDQIRIGYHREVSRQEFTKQNIDIFYRALEVSEKLYKATLDSSYWYQSFEIVERSKGFMLGQSLREKQLMASFSLPDSLLEKEKSLKNDIAFYEEDIFKLTHEEEGYDTILVKKFERQLFHAKRNFEMLLNQFDKDYPNYYQLKYATDVVSVPDIQHALYSDQAFIEYFWTDNMIYCFVIEKESFVVKKIPLHEKLRHSIDSLITMSRKKESSFNDSRTLLGLSAKVYQSILAPAVNVLKSSPKRITIVTDGPLGNINFDMLLYDSFKSATSWKELPYLVKKYSINHAYSASLIYQSIKHSSNPPKKDLLAFSFGEEDLINGGKISMGTFRSSTELLPGSMQEIKSISNLLEGDYFYGKLANESQFKAIASDYQILHLAIHGETDDDEPEKSKLLFYSKGDTIEDGFLHAFELYNMNLKASLAVLSACNTGSGKVLAGEGVMSLGRAFAYAGVNSMLLSHWEVSDAEAPQIMKVFYSELKKGKRKSEALQQAKLDFLENSNIYSSNPQLWSPFYIMGDDSPIKFSQSDFPIHYWWAIAAGIIILILFLVMRMRL